MIAYHGTIVGPLNVLRPFASPHANLKEACVYLSANKALSLVYIWNKPYMWMTFKIREDGIPVYYECFKNQLQVFYKGVKGYIYTCEGDFIADENIRIKPAVISRNKVEPIKMEMIDDVYETMLEYESNQLLMIERYEDRSQDDYAQDREMVISAIQRLKLYEGKHPMTPFVKETFPMWWDEANKRINENG